MRSIRLALTASIPLARRSAAPLLSILAMSGCAGYSASHGPRPLEPGRSVFAAGVSLLLDTGEPGLMPEISYRTGLTDRVDAGVEVAGTSAMVDALATVWEAGPWVLSAGLGASTMPGSFPRPAALHPEVYFGTNALFIAARPMVFLGRVEGEDGGADRWTAGVVPGLSIGTTLGRAECLHLLPTASAFSGLFVLTVNVRFPQGYDCD